MLKYLPYTRISPINPGRSAELSTFFIPRTPGNFLFPNKGSSEQSYEVLNLY